MTVIGGSTSLLSTALTLARRYRAVMGVDVVVAPAAIDEPISLEEAHLHLGLEVYGSPEEHPDDPWLTTIGIPAAREHCENFCGRAFAPQTLEASIRRFPAGSEWDEDAVALRLPMAAPLRGLLSVSYVDGDGVTQDVPIDGSVFDVDLFSKPARLFPVWGSTWPVTKETPNAIVVRYVAGFDVLGESPVTRPLPASVKIAMLLELGHLYNNRENTTEAKLAEIPGGVAKYLWPYKIEFGMA